VKQVIFQKNMANLHRLKKISKVIIMDLSKKILTLLVICCVIASATAVCAADVNTGNGYNATSDINGVSESQYQDNGGWAGSQYQDKGGWAGSQYQDEGGWAGSQYNETLENGTHVPSAGAPNNATSNTTGSVAQNTTSNATAPTPHNMLATGNPIVMLLGVTAIIGGYAVLKRKN
jgi:hypothetical protein